MLSYPGQEVEAIDTRHFEVEQDKRGQWVFGAIGVSAFADEIGDGVLAGTNSMDGVGDAGFLESALDEEDVVGPVFNYQNDGCVGHRLGRLWAFSFAAARCLFVRLLTRRLLSHWLLKGGPSAVSKIPFFSPGHPTKYGGLSGLNRVDNLGEVTHSRGITCPPCIDMIAGTYPRKENGG